jgi:chorismate mutase
MMIRGVRGAITVNENTEEAIWSATRELLEAMVERNHIDENDVASILFTTTPELTAAYPATAARLFGWSRTALMGFVEADITDGLPMCIRVLIHWNTNKSIDEINHIFLRDAVKLRPDLRADDAKEEA